MSTFAVLGATTCLVVVLAAGRGTAGAEEPTTRSTHTQTEETRIDVFIPLNVRRPFIERELELHVSYLKGRVGRETDVIGSVAVPLLPRWQVELEVPLVFAEPRGSVEVGGVGDVGLENKYMFYSSAERRTLVTGGVEARLPSGSARRGLGGESNVEPFVAAGVALGHFGLLGEAAYRFDIDSPARGPRAQELTAQAALGYHVGRFTPLLELTTVAQTRGGDTHRIQVYVTPGFNVRPVLGWTFALGLELPVTDTKAFDYALRARLVVEF